MKKYNLRLYLTLLAFTPAFAGLMPAQELISPMLSAKYIKLSDGSKRIDISLQAKEEHKMVQIESATIHIFAMLDTSKSELGNIFTNYKGEASLSLPANKILPVDKSGNTKLIAEFNGNKQYDKASADMMVKDVFLDLQLSKDSTKTITAIVYELNNKGEKVFKNGVDIVFNVKRLFCLYPVGTGTTDPAGTCTAIFPGDIPGDTSGRVQLVVRIQDNDTYATVEKAETVNWGKPLVIEKRARRGLGDTDAPLWMVYTLLVLLSGVWLHFLYIIFLVIRIDRIGKKLLTETTA